jgi:hypothetical protein
MDTVSALPYLIPLLPTPRGAVRHPIRDAG